MKLAMKVAKETKKPQEVSAQTIEGIKVNIGIRLDIQILNGIKAEAEKKALPYQTLINSVLKQHLDTPDLLSRIEALERASRIE